jgi:hypothetical protein
MDDIALVYRWSLTDLEALSLQDLGRWWARARHRLGARDGR